MKPAGAHRLDLRCVGIDREELDLLARRLLHVLQEILPGFGIDRGILDGGIGEDQNGGIDLFGRVTRNVGDQVAVVIGVAVVQLELGVRRRSQRQCRERGENSESFHDVLQITGRFSFQ